MLHIIITFKIFNTSAVFQLLQHYEMGQLKPEKQTQFSKRTQFTEEQKWSTTTHVQHKKEHYVLLARSLHHYLP